MHPLSGQTIILASAHGKEAALAPLFYEAFGAEVLVPPTLPDTDLLGTFSGERDRPGNITETMFLKVHLVRQQYPDTPILVSEGSFGPHPAVPLMAIDREWVGLWLPQDDRMVAGFAVSTETNYAHTEPQHAQDLITFREQANQSGPGHHLILDYDITSPWLAGQTEKVYHKGLYTDEAVQEAWAAYLAEGLPNSARLSTDMRAHHNPSRLRVIALAGADLIQTLNRRCTRCQSIGFELVGSNPGLPCANCGRPTKLPLSKVYECQVCDHQDVVPVEATAADAMYCDWCNG